MDCFATVINLPKEISEGVVLFFIFQSICFFFETVFRFILLTCVCVFFSYRVMYKSRLMSNVFLSFNKVLTKKYDL